MQNCNSEREGYSEIMWVNQWNSMTNSENIGVARSVNILICTNFILKVNTALVKKTMGKII